MVTESQSPTDAASAIAHPTVTVDELLARSGDLKGKLVEFAQGPRFASQLRSRLRKAADGRGRADEATVITTLDHFALQHRMTAPKRDCRRSCGSARGRMDEHAGQLGMRAPASTVATGRLTW